MNFIISAREFWRQKGPLLLYIFSLMFSLGVFISLDSLQVNITDYIDQEKQTLVGGDIKISSNQPFPNKISSEINAIKKENQVAEIYDFSSMVSTENASILSQIKVVSPAYPLYGTVEIGSGKEFSSVLKKGQVVVEQALLTRLSIKIGDEIKLGNTTLKVADIIVTEPDRSLGLFGFGPRLLVSSADLASLGLIGEKSRVAYETRVKIRDEVARISLTKKLKETAKKPVRVESLSEAETTLSRFSDRFLLFLKLVIFSLLILTGVGIVSILKAFLQSQRTIIATRKSIGETPKQILFSYLGTFGLWAGVGLFGAIAIAQVMIVVGEGVFSAILPKEIALKLSTYSVIKSLILGMGTTLLFATFALEQATAATPATLFRADGTTTNKNWARRSFWLGLIAIIYITFIALEIENVLWSAVFLLGIITLFLVFWGISSFVITIISKFDNRFSYRIKLVLRSLQRPGSSTGLFLGVFTLSLTLFFSLIVIESAIQRQFVLSYPENSPNVFLLDIKEEQVDELSALFAEPLNFYPVVRAPISRVNNETIQALKARSGGFGDNITRPFNITYYEKVKESEEFTENSIKGELFAEVDDGFVPVSVLDSIAEELGVKLGDSLVFNVQGIEIAAQITSFRKRLEAGSPSPFFYFVFQPKVLAVAPKTLFATGRFDGDGVAELQTTLSKKFPQISVLDTSVLSKQVGEILGELSGITRLFTLFNLFVGFIIFIASLMATSQKRKAEAVFYRLQGMTQKNVWRVVTYEFLFIGIFTIGVAVGFSALVGQALLHFLFDLSLGSLPASLPIYAVAMLASILLFGFMILYKPLNTTPITFIRSNVRE